MKVCLLSDGLIIARAVQKTAADRCRHVFQEYSTALNCCLTACPAAKSSLVAGSEKLTYVLPVI